MRRLSPTIKQFLEGLAYADLAEMLPPTAKDRLLAINREPAERSAAGAVPAGHESVGLAAPRRVGLFLGPYATNALLEYALDGCARLDAELVVFTFMEEAQARRLLEGVGSPQNGQRPALHVEHLSGNPDRALRSLKGRGVRLEFLVCDERGYLGHQILGGDISLDVPVVMVAPPESRRRQRVSEPPAGAFPAKP